MSASGHAVGAASKDNSIFGERSRRQFALYLAGAGCIAVSTLITRRSIARRFRVTYPKFFQPSNQQMVEVDGATEAAEALALATINVASVGLTFTSGLFWALNISNMEDVRARFGTQFKPDGTRIDINAEKEAEKWISSVLESMGKEVGAKDEKADEKKRGQ